MKSEHEDFLKITSEALTEFEDQFVEVISGVTKSINAYVQERLNLPPARESLRARFVSYLPQVLIRRLRAFRDRVMPLPKPLNFLHSLSAAANDLAAQGVVVDFGEVAAIEAVISAFHNDR